MFSRCKSCPTRAKIPAGMTTHLRVIIQLRGGASSPLMTHENAVLSLTVQRVTDDTGGLIILTGATSLGS